MKPLAFRFGALALLLLVVLDSLADEPKKPAERIDLCDPAALPLARVPFENPPDYRVPELTAKRTNAAVSVSLDVGFARHSFDRSLDRKSKDVVSLRSYDGGIVGPTIRVRPGDRLKINLKNRILRTDPDARATKDLNCPNGFNITNLHTHGLHMSPEGWADNIFKEIGPGESADFCFDVPANHPAGLFWYHPHRHGSTAIQVAGGLAGALIVEGGIDEVPEIKAAMERGREKILIFQQITYSIGPNRSGAVAGDDVYGLPVQRTKALPEGAVRVANTTVSGRLLPDIAMAPGEVQRWRCLHAGVNTNLKLAIVRADGATLVMHELARDGFPLERVTPQKSIEMYSGQRSDFLVQAPPEAGEWFLMSLEMPAGKSPTKKDQVREHLARIVVRGEPTAMKLPAADSIRKYALPPIPDAEVAKLPIRPIVFYYAVNPKATPVVKTFAVNGKAFGESPEDIRVKLGTAEEWRITSEGGSHPFHIHVNPFEVIETNPADGIKRYWRDTIAVTEENNKANPVVVRMRFEDFPGTTVLHCHSLDHEDQGMMAKVRIEGEAPPSRCDPKRQTGLPALPAKAPAWELRDFAEKPHRLTELVGRDVLLVFFRGLACGHCRSQLDALAKKRQALADAKLTVVAICPDAPDELRRAIKEDLPAEGLPFLILSDPKLATFKSYGCHDGRALHGTFLIDAAGMVRWQEVGDEPLMDVDRIFREGARKSLGRRSHEGQKAG